VDIPPIADTHRIVEKTSLDQRKEKHDRNKEKYTPERENKQY